MVAITVALDSRLAELGAQRFGRALADVSRVVGSTVTEVDRLNNGMTRGADAFARFTAAVASTSGESRELGRVIQAGGVPWFRNLGNRGASVGSGNLINADFPPEWPLWDVTRSTDLMTAPLGIGIVGGAGTRSSVSRSGRNPRSGGMNDDSPLRGLGDRYNNHFLEIVDRLRNALEDVPLDTNVGLLLKEYEARWIAADEGIARSVNVIRNARGSDDPRPILLSAFAGIDQPWDEQFDEEFFRSHIPNDDRLRSRFASESHQYFDHLVYERLREAYRNTFNESPPGDLLHPDTWIYGDLRPDSGRLSPSDQPDLFQHQRAGGIAAEADDLQRLVDARREDQIHLKRVEELRQAVAAAGAGEIAVIDDRAMALESVAMVNADGAVSALANADAVQMQTEAYRAQTETLGESYTPATKGAVEVTKELADAAVGLDAALKNPDPMAVAEEMEELSALGQQVGNSFASAFERAVFSGEELSDVLSALALDLARLVLQQQVLGPLAGGIGGLFDDVFRGILGIGSAGGVGGVTQSASTGHRGGIAGSLPSYARDFSPAVWLGASRYHFGGLAGDEVPAILRRGEEVLTRDDPRHRANGGMAGGGVAIHQTISIDAKAVNENGVDGAAADAVGRQMRAAVRSAVQQEIAQQSRVGGMLNRV